MRQDISIEAFDWKETNDMAKFLITLCNDHETNHFVKEINMNDDSVYIAYSQKEFTEKEAKKVISSY